MGTFGNYVFILANFCVSSIKIACPKLLFGSNSKSGLYFPKRVQFVKYFCDFISGHEFLRFEICSGE